MLLLTTGKMKEKGRKIPPAMASDIPISCSVHPSPPVINTQIQVTVQGYMYTHVALTLLMYSVHMHKAYLHQLGRSIDIHHVHTLLSIYTRVVHVRLYWADQDGELQPPRESTPHRIR